MCMNYSECYLPTDDTAPATAVLAFIHCLIVTAQSIKSQDSSHTVPNEAHLKKIRQKVNGTIFIFWTHIHKVQVCRKCPTTCAYT